MPDVTSLQTPGASRMALLASASVEVGARETDAPQALAARLAPGARVHVTLLPNAHYGPTIEMAKALAREGFVPVPHVAARSLAGEAALADYLARLSGEAGVREVLLVGGDLDRPRGPFADCLTVLRTELLPRHGVASVAFAGHPEGHPAVPRETIEAALVAKAAVAADQGLATSVVTQLCFEATPILDWLVRLRGLGLEAPVRIGAAAPTNPARLARFALRCGVGPSLRALTTQSARIGQLLTDAGPEPLIAELSERLAQDRQGRLGAIAGMHFFVFGSVSKAAAWLAAQQTAENTAP